MKKYLLFCLLLFIFFQCEFYINVPEKKNLIPSSPYFSPSSGIYDTTIDITITTNTEDGFIFFTIDGTTPSKTNFFSAGKKSVTFKGKKITVNALTYKNGFVSDISRITYR